ncbi:HlyD family efflux transporter periplasmic adaptor subunit [Streptomyces sp. RS10V-4]|uniref:HlyD family efflux transporter periplasmic adaptor subunit n=1 Tax=Streptomyces rhizoryzae TaxID=2932493 RepID=UPI0020056930|nr:HlyD family efflux transporter periplasmic adaptor subunit [Streptomyces rhizoryzae]MCK7625116.1 HlyD family efflux transporter periplasmic adaptor subunit [Streptomyces rhizoryzae]
MQFRQQALSKLQSPEELDLPVRFARPQGWLVLAVTVLVMVAATVWAVTGTVTSTLTAPGILTHGHGSYVLQSPVAGQVTAVLADEGKQVAANAPLVRIRTAQGTTTVVRALADGRLTALDATIGSVVTTGTDLASVERTTGRRDPLTATLYVPADSAATIPPGAAVDLTVASAPTQRFGVLRGHVAAIGRAAQSRQRISAFLGSAQLGEQFSRAGRPVAVLVRLDPAPTASGYAWSTSNGPPFALDSMTQATATVRLAAQHPIDWLLS